jgi:hypothetical protein
VGPLTSRKPPLAGRQLWTLRSLLGGVTVAELVGFLVAEDGWDWGAAGFLGAFVFPQLTIYVLTARSRVGSILTGTTMVAGVFLASMFATTVRGSHGLEGYWIPFIAWLVALAGWALEPRFRAWDRDTDW